MNIWKKFIALLPSDPLLIATVTAHNSDGTSNITWPGGRPGRVRGQTVAVGEAAYIKGGQIQGQAPTLPLTEFEI